MRKIEHIQQPPDKPWCGQAVVAMLLGISIEGTFVLVGTRGKTRMKQLTQALTTDYVSQSHRMIRVKKDVFPYLAILSTIWVDDDSKKKFKHWVLLSDGKIYDPAAEKVNTIEDYIEYIYTAANGRITSYMPLIPYNK